MRSEPAHCVGWSSSLFMVYEIKDGCPEALAKKEAKLDKQTRSHKIWILSTMDADGATDVLGIRYAPPDPNLPEPGKGLIYGMYLNQSWPTVTESAKYLIRKMLTAHEVLIHTLKNGVPQKAPIVETTREESCHKSECKRGKLEEENQESVLSVDKIKYLADNREEDIWKLEKSLAEKEFVIQKMEGKIGKLEEEKLRDKLTMLEQIHEECSHHSKVREGKWSYKMEKMVADLNSFTLELESKEAHSKDITTEVDDLNSLEMECEIVKLEEDNRELVLSLKMHEESQASNSSSSKHYRTSLKTSLKHLKNKLKTLEQIHSDCSDHNKPGEAEWNLTYEKIGCRLEFLHT
ncbi:coatomer subunit beta'-2-like protein [Tanacetum coccineum]